MQNFFFVMSGGKFARIDFEKITHVIITKDHAQIGTTTGVYTPCVSIKEVKELLPNDRFTWINENTAIPHNLPMHNG